MKVEKPKRFARILKIVGASVGVLILVVALAYIAEWAFFVIGSHPIGSHPGPKLTIYNQSDQTVAIYLNGYDEDRIDSHQEGIFWPSEKGILQSRRGFLLIEAKADGGQPIFARDFSSDELNSERWGLIIP